MIIPNYFYSCDWGTTHFRLRLVESQSLKVIEERKSDRGVKSVYSDYKSQNESSQFDFFCQYLHEQLTHFPSEHQDHLIVLSGMASSSIGLFELEYAEMPLSINASNLKWKFLQNQEMKLVLVSGAKNDHDVMRGEEIQVVGLVDHMSKADGLIILPGTHSKHILIENGRLIDSRTYMTGELFNIISTTSILANSLTECDYSPLREPAFTRGLEIGLPGDMTSQLFSIRVNQLLHNADQEDSYFLLSGMIIGDELSSLKASTKHILLAASEPLMSMYTIALKHIDKESQLTIFNESDLELATLNGQCKLLAQIELPAI